MIVAFRLITFASALEERKRIARGLMRPPRMASMAAMNPSRASCEETSGAVGE
jgi:hypothetical protein